ncbi:MAG: permease-like cell division protein FtsX [Heliobacteriaceae bacterium]|nr:permease-like cell division protein FtsX [Heliobacteriaceae bacterium]
MKFRTLGYFFGEAFRSLGKNSWLSIASIATVAISLLILGSSVMMVLNSQYWVQTLASDLEIAVIMDVDTPAGQVKMVGDKLRNHNLVSEVTFVTKAEALTEMRQKMGDRGDYFRALGDQNPFPDLFRVKAKDPRDMAVLAGEFQGYQRVERVLYGQGVAENLLNLSYWVRIGGLVVMGLMGGAAVFLIATTIRLTVYARRQEVGIMKSVGATNWFIRWPFLLEGMFLGFFGSLVAVSLLFAAYAVACHYIQTALPFVAVRTDPAFLWQIFEVLAAAGVAIGAAGSMISLRKYLHV